VARRGRGGRRWPAEGGRADGPGPGSPGPRNVTGCLYNTDMPEPSPPPTSSGQPRSADCGSAGRAVLPLIPGFERRRAKQRPLPDAVAVRLLGVPDSAPPYDDNLAEAGSRGRRGDARPRRPARSPGRPKAPRTRSEPTGAPDPATPTALGKPAQRSGPPLPLRRPAPWPSQFAQVLAETLAGSRPPGQIRPWTSEQARRRIRQLGPRLAADVQPRVRRIMTSRPAAGVVEMTVIVGFGPRIRVLAVRLERDEPPQAGAGPYRGRGRGRGATARWTCTAIEAA
jgi:hypothetical protein